MKKQNSVVAEKDATRGTLIKAAESKLAVDADADADAQGYEETKSDGAARPAMAVTQASVFLRTSSATS